jgi:hypothetical protein
MLETEVLIGVVIILIAIIAYLVYVNRKSKTSNYENLYPSMSWDAIEKSQNKERNFNEPEVRDRAREGLLFNGDKYTGSASKYFPHANEYPTLGTAQVEEKNLDNIMRFADANEDPGFNNQEYMEDQQIDAKTRKNQKEWANEQRFFNGVARSADDEFETGNYVSWQGLRRPQPIKPHGMMPFITEIQNEEYKDNHKFNFQ